MNVDHKTYTGKGAHAYIVEVYADKNCRVTKDFSTKKFEVHATNRDQAARKLERDGYEIYSVNMIG